MTRRRISRRKRIHEAKRHIQIVEGRIYRHFDMIDHIDRITTRIASDGTGSIYMPSVGIFEHITPLSPPQGIVFNDNSFLVFKEIFRYDYPSEEAAEPKIIQLEYSFHFQMPRRQFFFRYDFHPGVGDEFTHPLHHLHAGGWLRETESLPSVPRFPASDMTLGEVLELIQVNFFFRYDFHPEVGDRLTHPLHHLHAGGWLNETDSLPSVPRFPVSHMTLGEVLELIQVNFFLN